jgi:DNA-binding response OmpR family regulator
MARILLIEDNDGLRTILAEHIALAGHSVIEASDGREGLDHFRRGGADLVVTDIVMPETEGLEVLREIRTAQPPVPVIAISGGGLGSGEDYLAMATALGAAKVILKPFPPAVLIAAIDELLPGDTLLRADQVIE